MGVRLFLLSITIVAPKTFKTLENQVQCNKISNIQFQHPR